VIIERVVRPATTFLTQSATIGSGSWVATYGTAAYNPITAPHAAAGSTVNNLLTSSGAAIVTMLRILEQGLHHPSGLVRKGCAFVLQGPKRLSRGRSRLEEYAATPPVLANSFPKSGTHLLDQIVDALPQRRNYGAFLSSMTSSFQFRPRNLASVARFIGTTTPGELVRAHLFFDEDYARELKALNFVHYFIIRDLRDVVLSEANYLRSQNRWHRLHRYFRQAPTLEDAITLSIRGFPELAPRIDYPDIGRRFEKYAGWLDHPDVFVVRFEELTSNRRQEALCGMADFSAARSQMPVDVEKLADAMAANIDPLRSHTFRKAKSGGWREQFTAEHRRLFENVAGDLLRRHGFAADAAPI